MIYKTTSFKLFESKITVTSLNLWCVYAQWGNKIGWVRIFGGYGIVWRPKGSSMSFSERMGIKKYATIGNYRFTILKPIK